MSRTEDRRADRSLGEFETLAGVDSSLSDLASTARMLEADDIEVVDLSQRYDIAGVIGRGGMGEVLRAVDKRLKRPVAIKRVRGDLAHHPQALARFLTEARAVASLNHANIVQVYDYGRTVEGPFLIMELVDGESLADRLTRGRLPAAEAVGITTQVCQALERAHSRNIIHRDIKPSNILLTPDGSVKLTDFGLARETAGNAMHTQTGAVLGTFDYMPPEQRKDSSRVDARSDLWSLAGTLYQMLTGDTPQLVDQDAIPDELRPVLVKALQSKPELRYGSARELATALREALKKLEARGRGDRRLSKGQCAQCGTENDPQRKFCEECGASLRQQCLSCRQPTGVWEVFCGECGANMAEALDRRRNELASLRQQSETFQGEYRFPEALAAAQTLANEADPRFAELRDWGRTAVERIQSRQAEARSESAARFAEAAALYSKGEDVAAVRMIEKIPEPLRDEATLGLLTSAKARVEESTALLRKMKAGVAARQLDDLLPVTTRYLELHPDDLKVQKLHRQVLARLEKSGTSPGTRNPVPGSDDIRRTEGARRRSVLNLVPELRLNLVGPRRPLALLGAAILLTAAIVSIVYLATAGWREPATPVVGSGRAPDPIPPKPKVIKSGERPGPIVSPFSKDDARARQRDWAAALGTGIEIKNTLDMPLVLIPAGEFDMGSPADEKLANADEKPQHRVRISQPFYLGKYEVTRGEFGRFVQRADYKTDGEKLEGGWGYVASRHSIEAFSRDFTWKSAGFEYQDNHPVMNVTWNDAVAFCKWLSEQEHQIYRLPTEAEWEFAARAGTTSRTRTDMKPAEVGNVESPELSRAMNRNWAVQADNDGYAFSAPVGRFPPNPFGLHDMLGNVWEWCSDSYDAKFYEARSALDPAGPTTPGQHRVGRGGGWYHPLQAYAKRNPDVPIRRGLDWGFRVVRQVENVPPKPLKEQSVTTLAEPPLLIVPFTAGEARAAQADWAKVLGRPVRDVNSIGMVQVLIPPGRFEMGSPVSEPGHDADETLHGVRIMRPFYLGALEVTQNQYELVTGEKPSWFSRNGEGRASVLHLDTGLLPVERVSWDDAVRFCEKLTRLERDAKRLPDGWEYRLPTEAEWEYACHGGTTTAYSFGQTLSPSQANVKGDNGVSLGRTSVAGSFDRGDTPPHPFGLSDMHGNVTEWCSDSYGRNYYQSSVVDDPTGPAQVTTRVMRGGCWSLSASYARCAYRDENYAGVRSNRIGFRVACAPIRK